MDRKVLRSPVLNLRKEEILSEKEDDKRISLERESVTGAGKTKKKKKGKQDCAARGGAEEQGKKKKGPVP